MASPAFSFSSLVFGVNVSLVVTVNSSAGNFCSITLGAYQRFFESSGILSLYSLKLPLAVFKSSQVGFGLAIHCHCLPSSVPLNSSLSTGVIIEYICPTLGFL